MRKYLGLAALLAVAFTIAALSAFGTGSPNAMLGSIAGTATTSQNSGW